MERFANAQSGTIREFYQQEEGRKLAYDQILAQLQKRKRKSPEALFEWTSRREKANSSHNQRWTKYTFKHFGDELCLAFRLPKIRPNSGRAVSAKTSLPKPEEK